MVTQIPEGVRVSVETVYQSEYSNPAQEHFMFAYKITIENLSDYTVQLMRRHWYIFDSNGTLREVEGEGVVGEQPVIEPGESPIDAARRELWEETGMFAFDLVEIYNDGITVAFRVLDADGRLRSSPEGLASWVSLEKLMQGRYSSYLRKVLKKLEL